MSRIAVAVPALLAALFFAQLAGGAAPIYSWTDEQGRRQVSDRPPDGAVKELKVRGGRSASESQPAAAGAPAAPVTEGASAPATSPARAAEKKGATLNEKALEFNKRQIEREENRAKLEKTEAEARERAQRCEQAKGYLRNLQAGGRATRLDPKTGERLFLDDKEREREVTDAGRTADSWCRPAPTPPPGTTQVPAPK